MSEVKQYASRDIMALDEAGNHYIRHVDHMTREKLHSKSDIAAELGWRDMQIAELKAQRDALEAENVALVRYSSVCAGAIELWNSWADPEDKLASAPETPATAAYLNSVRAEGVELFISQSAYELPHRLKSALLTFAAQLRAGEPS